MPNPGWTVSKIIAQCNAKTENRLANKSDFDLRMEFFMGLDEFCQEKHYWWRREFTSFLTQPGTQEYDLSSAANGGANAPDCQEIEEAFVVNASPICGPHRVHPSFSPREQLASLFGGQAVGDTIPHSGYFIDGFQNLVFTSPISAAYTVAFTYYGTPMVNDSNYSEDNIPLVPPPLHWGLPYMLLRRMYEYLYSQDDPRNVQNEERYQQFKLSAARWKQYSTVEAIHARTGMGIVASGRGAYWR